MDDALACMNGLYGTAVRLTRDGDAARDLVQDTYLKALRAQARFEPGTNLKAWLYTILHNTWRNRRRDGARSRVAFDSDTVDAAFDAGRPGVVERTTPESILLAGVLDADLRAALDRLPEAFREAVWLRDVEDLTYQEIADVLSVPIGTVMSRISRGRKLLHGYLTDAGRVPAGRTGTTGAV
jgi:RNA polymerase sigma-70 factor (ECF subfamily)